MAYTAKLERNDKYIEFNDGDTQYLAPSFIPPTISLVPSFATGTSASRYSAEQKIDERLISQNISIEFKVNADSEAQINGIISSINLFLRDAGDENNPTYFSWKNSDTPEPIWGQGTRKLLITHGAAFSGSRYGNNTVMNNCRLELVVSAIDGQSQTLPKAKGAIINMRNATSGLLDGVVARSNDTNLLSNPSVETNTTSWTAFQCSLAQSQDVAYSGVYSLKATATDTSYYAAQSYTIAGATTGRIFTGSGYVYASPELVGTTLRFVMAETGGAAATAAENYNFTLAKGWNYVRGTYTIVENDRTGVQIRFFRPATVMVGEIFYVDAAMLTETDYTTEYIDGDSLGCAWSGTAHASTSTAGAGAIDLTTPYNPNGGTVEIICTASVDFDESIATALHILGGAIVLYYDKGNNRFTLTDGTNSANSSTPSFTRGTRLIFHLVYGYDGLAMYIDGAEDGTNATYTYRSAVPNAYFGSNNSAGTQSGFILHHACIYDEAFTAAQVLSRYNDLVQNTSLYQSPIPWLWTIDGDGVLDDSVDSTHAAYGVIGGISGDVPTNLDLTATPASDDAFFSLCPVDNYVRQVQLYATKTTSVNNAAALIYTVTLTNNACRILNGLPSMIFTEMIDAGSDEIIAIPYLTVGGTSINLKSSIIDPHTANYYEYIFGTFPAINYELFPVVHNYTISGERTAAGAANVTVNGIVVYGYPYIIYASGGGNNTNVAIKNGKPYGDYSSSYFPVIGIGSVPKPVPNKVNMFFGASTTYNSTVAWNPITINSMSYTPRYINV